MPKLFLFCFLFLHLISYSQQDRGCGGVASITIETPSINYYYLLEDYYLDTVIITIKDADTIQILWDWISYMEPFNPNFIPAWTKNDIELDSSYKYTYNLFSCLSTGSSCPTDCANSKIITNDTGVYVFQNCPSYIAPVIIVQKEKDTIVTVKAIDNNVSFLKLYPIPSINVVKAKFINDAKNTIYIDIYDLNGKLTQQLMSSNSEVLIDISDLKLGVYFFKYHTMEENLGDSKFIKISN